ncbi:MAG TPA: hypothetical protein VHC97_11075 [Thermoanaerobaculia bacterium]|jgi:hypothetical protein|nr:hypothetical protein [Thermoanaerobaculia bacterium]
MKSHESWVARPILWFAIAYTVNQILHELAHALTAYSLGIPSTLFHFYVDLDQERATLGERALFGVAGPVFSLAFGTLCGLAYRRGKGSAAEMPLFYLSVFGLSIFFGNLISASFVGDFSRAAVALGLPRTARYAASMAGALSLAALLFWAGGKLRRWVPVDAGPVRGTFGIVALPALIGTALVILVNQPMRGGFLGARAAEASFWIFAAAGALVKWRNPRDGSGSSPWRWPDVALFLLAVLIVRVMARGIPFVP